MSSRKQYSTNVNWSKAQKEYIESNITQDQLAEKYKVNPRTVYLHARDEKWTAKRKEFRQNYSEKLLEKSASLKADLEHDLDTDMYDMFKEATKIATKLLAIANKQIDETDNYSPTKFKDLTTACETIQRCQRQTKGKIDELEIKKLELMKRKLDIEEDKNNPDKETNQDTSFITALEGSTVNIWTEKEQEISTD